MTLVGISSHVNDYRLCWALNRGLGLQLVRRRSDIVDESPERAAYFAVFDHHAGEEDAQWTLVNNHSPAGPLLKEQAKADFFLMVDEETGPDPTDLLDRLRNIDLVLTAFPLDLRTIRGGHKLLQ